MFTQFSDTTFFYVIDCSDNAFTLSRVSKNFLRSKRTKIFNQKYVTVDYRP